MYRIRIIGIMIVLLACCGFVNAQEMKVVSFKKLDEITANRSIYKRTDKNGKTAALIKIVTKETGFAFDGYTAAPVGDPVYNPGQVWLYVPARAQKLDIILPKYNSVLRAYEYPIPIEEAATYEMVLDPGVGKYVNISTTQVGATIRIDGDSIGVSPIAMEYLLFGKHKIEASKGKMEGELELDVNTNTSDAVSIDMKDVSDEFRTVRFTVDGGAEIFRDNNRKGIGTWDTELRIGTYVIETRKSGCSNNVTTINLTKEGPTTFKLQSPIPYHGFVTFHTNPHDVTISDKDSKNFTATDGQKTQLTVGKHYFEFSKKGYIGKEVVYDIRKDDDISDTIVLNPIQYIKKNMFYLGAGYTMSGISGASIYVGAVFANIDLELGYTIGMGKTDELVWYSATDHEMVSRMQYGMSTISCRLGYQILASSHISFTPQLGLVAQSLSGEVLSGTEKIGDGTSASYFSVGCKAKYVPAQHVSLFIQPEFLIGASVKDSFKTIAEKANLTQGGIAITAGLLFNF